MAIDTSNNNAAAIVKTLRMGSGVDIQALAKGLAEAESKGRIDTITARKASVETSVSGYAILSTGIDSLKYLFDGMTQRSSLSASSVSASPPGLILRRTATAVPDASYQMTVRQLARGQTSVIAVNSATDVSNLGSLDIGGRDFTPAAGASAQDLAAAINAANAGLNATVINRRSQDGSTLVDDWVVVVQGSVGSANAFDVSINGVAQEPEQAALDARLRLNGIDVYRSDNRIDDVVPGVVLDLREAIEGETYRIRTVTDRQPLKDKLQELAEVYNELQGVLDELVNPASKASEFSGSLARDKALVSAVRNELRRLFEQTSATASGGIASLRDLGFSFSLNGTLTLDVDKLDTLLRDAPGDVETMMSGSGSLQWRYTPAANRGLGLDISLKLDGLIGANGVIAARKQSATARISGYETQLEALEKRLQQNYERYINQFAAMESFVQRSNDIGKYLEGQFKAMQKSLE